jgi:hypothetical protein
MPPSTTIISPVTASICSSLRPVTQTVAPSPANQRAMAAPIPVPAPVMSAIFPCKRVTRELLFSRWSVAAGVPTPS